MKRFAAMISLTMAAVFSAGLVLAAVPDNAIVIKEIQKSKPPVTFQHSSHKALDCVQCHHKDAAGKEQRCSACHTDKADGKRLELKEAFHKHCRDCHKAEKKGPQACNDCHKK
jgi:uncharacterized paraquat-inducible protein A